MHYDPLNMCLPPPCGEYYFFDYDPPNKRCKLSTGFHLLAAIIIGVFVLAECFLNEAVIFLSRKVERNAIPAGN